MFYQSRFSKIEPYVFIAVVILNLVPVLTGAFFPTLDGAAHLYNSNLINTLLFEKNEAINQFFILNSEPVPNWTGHIILSFFNYFFPGFVAEKILLLFYLIVFPLSFRALIKTVAPGNWLLCYFIFPFTYSFVFFLGFYNFSISLIFLMLAIHYWIKKQNNYTSIKTMVVMFVLIILTYFSHIFTFAILLLLIGLQVSIKFVKDFTDGPDKIKIINFLKKSSVLFLISFIPLLLFTHYFSSRLSTENNTFTPSAELIAWLLNIRPIIALDFIKEEVFTKKIFYIIVILLFTVLYNKIVSIKSKSIFSHEKLLWLIAALSMLFLYFILPDSDGNAGYVSVRLGLLFFIFLIIWLSTQKIPQWLCLLSVVVILFCNVKLNSFYIEASRHLSKVAMECYRAADFILPNSTVLPINNSDNWLHLHFSNYLGVDKPIVILENYECSTGYFPVKWNPDSRKVTSEGKEIILPFIYLADNLPKTDYIFILGTKDSFNQELQKNIVEKYELAYASKHCKLYRLKKNYGLL